MFSWFTRAVSHMSTRKRHDLRAQEKRAAGAIQNMAGLTELLYSLQMDAFYGGRTRVYPLDDAREIAVFAQSDPRTFLFVLRQKDMRVGLSLQCDTHQRDVILTPHLYAKDVALSEQLDSLLGGLRMVIALDKIQRAQEVDGLRLVQEKLEHASHRAMLHTSNFFDELNINQDNPKKSSGIPVLKAVSPNDAPKPYYTPPPARQTTPALRLVIDNTQS